MTPEDRLAAVRQYVFASLTITATDRHRLLTFIDEGLSSLATESLIDADLLEDASHEYDRAGWLSGDRSEAYRARWIAAEYFRLAALTKR